MHTLLQQWPHFQIYLDLTLKAEVILRHRSTNHLKIHSWMQHKSKNDIKLENTGYKSKLKQQINSNTRKYHSNHNRCPEANHSFLSICHTLDPKRTFIDKKTMLLMTSMWTTHTHTISIITRKYIDNRWWIDRIPNNQTQRPRICIHSRTFSKTSSSQTTKPSNLNTSNTTRRWFHSQTPNPTSVRPQDQTLLNNDSISIFLQKLSYITFFKLNKYLINHTSIIRLLSCCHHLCFFSSFVFTCLSSSLFGHLPSSPRILGLLVFAIRWVFVFRFSFLLRLVRFFRMSRIFISWLEGRLEWVHFFLLGLYWILGIFLTILEFL